MARSVNKVDSYALGRKKLIADGNSRAGSFTVAAGEIVYVGDFAPECVDGDTRIWRYHVVGRVGFKEYLARNIKPKYPFLDTETVQYRLLKTSAIGNDYELQCYFPSSTEQVESGNVIYDGEDCVAN